MVIRSLALILVLLAATIAPAGRACAASRAALVTPQELVCIRSAAAYYHRASDPISTAAFVQLAIAVRITEGGRSGRVSRNTNGTVDIGPMQINSIHLPLLASYGITYDALLNNACQNVFVGVWILHANLASSSTLWRGVGNYNSPHHLALNRAYQRRVWRSLQLVWAHDLDRLPHTAR